MRAALSDGLVPDQHEHDDEEAEERWSYDAGDEGFDGVHNCSFEAGFFMIDDNDDDSVGVDVVDFAVRKDGWKLDRRGRDVRRDIYVF